METNFFRLANAGAMRQGVFFGLWWVMGFACVIGSFSAPLLALLTFFFFVSTPVLGGVLAVRFCRDSGRTDLSVGRLYLYGVLLYFYASIWLAVAVYVYFAFMDDGFFFGCYLDYLHRPEVQAQLSTPALQSELSQLTGGKSIETLIADMAATDPIVFSANVINTNLMAGLVLALPTAWVARRIRLTK